MNGHGQNQRDCAASVLAGARWLDIDMELIALKGSEPIPCCETLFAAVGCDSDQTHLSACEFDLLFPSLTLAPI